MNFDHTNQPEMFPAIFENYADLGGAIPRSKFSDILQKFYDYTFDAYIHGDGSRENSMHSFRQFLDTVPEVTNPVIESNRIFRAVDSFGAYT